jgi:hypothetical protein
MFILGQAFGVAALVFEILTFQLKTKRSMLRAQIIANLFWSMSYIFLEAYSGTALSVMALTRVVVFYFLKDTSLKSRGGAVVILTAMAIFVTIATWGTWRSIFAFAGWFTMTMALVQRKEQNARKLGILQSALWMVYDISYKSFFGIFAETLNIISTSIALWRFRSSKKRKRSVTIKRKKLNR